DAVNPAPTTTHVPQHLQTPTQLHHAIQTFKNKLHQLNTHNPQPNYTQPSTHKKQPLHQALQPPQTITHPTNPSNPNKHALQQ
ncbi:hypothetical protein, partial [Staphylococcus aureus]|uniref:hypothetical protein n=1 Tax=Staphylococcus aureus TaxID=1280 RepID=UPI001C92F7FB